MMTQLATSLITPMVFSLIQSVASSLLNAISRKEVTRAGKGKESGIVPLLALPLIIRDLVKRVRTAGREYDNMDKCF